MKIPFIIGLLLLTSACNMPASASATESAPASTVPPPTPITVPAIPSAGPTETVIPTLEPLPLYFTDEFDAGSTYWEFLQTGGTIPPLNSIEKGSLRIDISSPDTWLIGVHTVNTYPDVFIRAKTSISPTGSAGLICRYSEESGWYEFNASSNGTYSVLLGQWLSPGVAKYVPIISAGSSLLSGGLNNELGLFCQDNFLLLYVNNALLRRVEVTKYGLTEGRVGVTAASFSETPIVILFEWVSVSQQ